MCNFLDGRIDRRDGATVLVSLADGALVQATVPAGAAVPADGAKVVVAVRPEKIVIAAAGPQRAGSLRARLDNLVYVGTAVHFHLRTAGGVRLVAYRQNNAALPPTLHPGAEVQLSWAGIRPAFCSSSYRIGQRPGTLTPALRSSLSLSSMQRAMTSFSSTVKTLRSSMMSRPLT